MENLMKAICLTPAGEVELQNVPKPTQAQPGYLLIKMTACAINPGDKAFIGRTFPIGIVLSRYDIYGASGVGIVIETGDGVPAAYKGKNVSIYRSLAPGDEVIGTWSEYAHVPHLDCAILPVEVDMDDYAGSLVNIITPYAFLKQITGEGHKGIISTAGSSATGMAMLGICQANNVQHISIVRTEEAKKELEALGADNILVETAPDFKAQFKELSQALQTTAVFDGVGGAILNIIFDVIPNNTTVYTYGYLGGPTPLTIHTSMLMRGITIKGFSNFRSQTVQNRALLEQAMKDISSFIHLPHFKTKAGQKFKLEDIKSALAYSSGDGSKAVLCP
jgi:NADPH2:quinone reductase